MANPDNRWIYRAACSQADTALFFSQVTEETALGYCRECPVVAECAASCEREESGSRTVTGVRGNETPQQRYDRRFYRSGNRRRKDAA